MKKKREFVTSLKLSPAQATRLDHLAQALGSNRNAVMRRLIENAQIQPVARSEPVSVIQINSRHDAANLTGSSITAA